MKLRSRETRRMCTGSIWRDFENRVVSNSEKANENKKKKTKITEDIIKLKECSPKGVGGGTKTDAGEKSLKVIRSTQK